MRGTAAGEGGRVSVDRKQALEALRGTRIVATLPVANEHGGYHHHVAMQQIAALRAHGAEVFPFDVTYSQTGDTRALFSQIGALGGFRPQIALSTGGGGPQQLLRCRTGRITMTDGWYVPNNLFVDHLHLPTILMWDSMVEFVTTLRAGSLVLADSPTGVIARARDQIASPLYYHMAFDQQNVDGLRKLGVLTTSQVRTRLSWTLPNYRVPDGGPVTQDRDVIFTGNLFRPSPVTAGDRALGILARFRNGVLARLEPDITACYWDAVEQALAEIDPDDAGAAGLDYDHTFFWTFLVSDLMARVVTQGRLSALRASRHPVEFYGLLHDPVLASLLAGSAAIYRGSAAFDTELPALFARSKVTLDVVTAWFPTSVTGKVLHAFLAGGLCLFNAKSAFADAFGSAAEQVMYRDFDDMGAKLDYLLSHDRERRELAEHLRRQIAEQCNWATLVGEMVAWVKETHPGVA